jgi:outer membrane protein TolC
MVLAIPPVAWCQQTSSPSSDVLTVAQAVALALQNNVNVKNAILGVGQSEDKLTAVRTKRLPSLKLALIESHLLTPIDLTFNEGAFGTFRATGPIPAGRTTLQTSAGFKTDILAQASQPLSQLYRIGLDIQEFETKRDVALQQLRLQQQTVVFDVKQAYYTLLQTQIALEATEESIASLRELDRITDNYVKQQTALKSQSLSVKSQLANAEYQALTQRNTLASQQEQLNELLGRDIQTPLRVNPAPEATPIRERSRCSPGPSAPATAGDQERAATGDRSQLQSPYQAIGVHPRPEPCRPLPLTHHERRTAQEYRLCRPGVLLGHL